MKILYLPAETGTGHNMRAFAIGSKIREQYPDSEQHVFLGSKRDVFSPMFSSIGVHVHHSATEIDHSNSSQLGIGFDWTSYVTNYLAQTFISGDKMLRAVALIREIAPDVVVSDYNIAGSLASEIVGVPHILVTERYDFTLGQVNNSDLVSAGFTVADHTEVNTIRSALTVLFEWITQRAHLVITDKPPIAELDRGTPVLNAIERGNGHFVGPVVRDECSADPVARKVIEARFGLSGGDYVVAGVGGTSMFVSNKENLLANYLDAFREIRRSRPDLQLVLIGRQEFTEPVDGVTFLNYVTDWHSLVKHAAVVLSPPGWISVTEMAVMRANVVYVLSGNSEYHELEAMRRLALLGYTTLTQPDVQALQQILHYALDRIGEFADSTARASKVIAPIDNGAEAVAKLLAQVVAEASVQLPVTHVGAS